MTNAETRCKKCRRLFFRGSVVEAEIEIKCPKCGYTQMVIKRKKSLIFQNKAVVSNTNKSDSIAE